MAAGAVTAGAVIQPLPESQAAGIYAPNLNLADWKLKSSHITYSGKKWDFYVWTGDSVSCPKGSAAPCKLTVRRSKEVEDCWSKGTENYFEAEGSMVDIAYMAGKLGGPLGSKVKSILKRPGVEPAAIDPHLSDMLTAWARHPDAAASLAPRISSRSASQALASKLNALFGATEGPININATAVYAKQNGKTDCKKKVVQNGLSVTAKPGETWRPVVKVRKQWRVVTEIRSNGEDVSVTSSSGWLRITEPWTFWEKV